MTAEDVLRAAAVIVGWLTVAGGLTLATLWVVFGRRSFGPEDELMAQAGAEVDENPERIAAFSASQVWVHGFFGITAAGLVSYAVARSDDRSPGYWAALAVAAITIGLGYLMYRKWTSSRRPATDGRPSGDHGPKVEDRLPGVVVYAHGAAAVGFVALLVTLLVVD